MEGATIQFEVDAIQRIQSREQYGGTTGVDSTGVVRSTPRR